MNDRDFLIWLHARLEHVHEESPCYDYMHKLRCIIKSTPETKRTPNISSYNTLEELTTALAKRVCSCKGFYKDPGCPLHGRKINR